MLCYFQAVGKTGTGLGTPGTKKVVKSDWMVEEKDGISGKLMISVSGDALSCRK